MTEDERFTYGATPLESPCRPVPGNKVAVFSDEMKMLTDWAIVEVKMPNCVWQAHFDTEALQTGTCTYYLAWDGEDRLHRYRMDMPINIQAGSGVTLDLTFYNTLEWRLAGDPASWYESGVDVAVDEILRESEKKYVEQLSPTELRIHRLEERIRMLGDSPSGRLAARELERMRDMEREALHGDGNGDNE